MSKEIVYTVISKENNLVVCEYTEHRGNFEQVAHNILSKVKPDTRATICFEKEFFFYCINVKGITYMCLCNSDYPKETAFIYLENLHTQLTTTFTEEEINNLRPYSKFYMDKFTPIIKDKMLYYNQNPDANDSLRDLKNEVLQYRENVIKSYENLMEREDKINLVVKKADSLKQESGVYYGSSKRVRRAARLRKIMFYAFAIVIIFLLIYIVIGLSCGFDFGCFKSENDSKRYLSFFEYIKDKEN